jgi:hypothetical protein
MSSSQQARRSGRWKLKTVARIYRDRGTFRPRATVCFCRSVLPSIGNYPQKVDFVPLACPIWSIAFLDRECCVAVAFRRTEAAELTCVVREPCLILPPDGPCHTRAVSFEGIRRRIAGDTQLRFVQLTRQCWLAPGRPSGPRARPILEASASVHIRPSYPGTPTLIQSSYGGRGLPRSPRSVGIGSVRGPRMDGVRISATGQSPTTIFPSKSGLRFFELSLHTRRRRMTRARP